jgi:RNA polymerase sigma factor (sigma-70 family)
MNRDEASKLLSSLFETWYSTLVRYVYHLTGSLELAEDTVQEALMLLYRELREGRAIDNPKGWTLCVVRRQISKQVRNYQSMNPLHQTLEALDSLPASLHIWREPGFEREDTHKLFSVLTPRELEVILLRMEAMKYREIARQLGISSNSVNTLLARALRKLQKAAGKKPASAAVLKAIDDDEDSSSKTLH